MPSRDLRDGRVLAPALPLVGHQPLLEIREPQIGPRQDRLSQGEVAVPLSRSGQPQTQAHRSFGVDVREAATVSQGDEVGCQHPSVRMAVPLELDADLVLTRQRARLNRCDPVQPTRQELPPPERGGSKNGALFRA